MKISFVIEARTKSTRLPNKILKYCYKNITFLEYMIRRIKRLPFLNNIIIATTHYSEDIQIVKIAKKCKVSQEL